jgi:branched-chain amino acid transport system permease protein
LSGSLNAYFRLDPIITIFAAAILGTVVAFLIGLPALRIRGLFLAVTTLAFALTTSSFLLDRQYFPYLPDPFASSIGRLKLLGIVDISTESHFYYFSLAVLGFVLLAARGLQRSRIARVLIATRENERAAQAFGLNVTRARLTAFALSGFFASLAGGLFVLHQQALGEDAYQPTESIRALSMVVVGGLGSFPGALLGTLFVKSTDWFNNLLPQAVRFLFQYSGSGVGLLFVLLWLRGGLGSVLYRIRDQLLRLVAKRRGLIVPSLIADVLQPEVDVLKQYAAAGGEPTGRLSAASNAPNGTGLLAQAVSRREPRK